MINIFAALKGKTELKAMTVGHKFLKIRTNAKLIFYFNIILPLNTRKKKIVGARTEDKAVPINVFETTEFHLHISTQYILLN